MAGGKNRFNRIDSKEWLPFQKSWFRFSDNQAWIRSNFRFFTTREESDYHIFYRGQHAQSAKAEANELAFKMTNKLEDATELQFAFLDLRSEIADLQFADWETYREKLISVCHAIFQKMVHRRFLMVALPNICEKDNYYPIAWDLAIHLSQFFTLKDEKIACVTPTDFKPDSKQLISQDHFYCLYFRKDENSGIHRTIKRKLFEKNEHQKPYVNSEFLIPSWFILKPQRRKKKEVLHPAKFPEDLAELFVQKFSEPNQNIFDPMSGTGSTQLAALMHGRNGYGTELSSFFAEIARERSIAFLFEKSKEKPLELMPKMDILEADARNSLNCGFAEQDLMITSPPYWDMLNMKGAENQAKRVEKGLRTNYSEDEFDIGNISDYQQFLDDLKQIYFQVVKLLKPGGIIIIVVKNIKKKGKNYPLAYDLAALLQEKLILLPEVFWCQDDISIAPYGYGNTFVSNTFHQYCLIFQKPIVE